MEIENPNQQHPEPAQSNRNGSEEVQASHEHTGPAGMQRLQPPTAPSTKRPARGGTLWWVLGALLVAGVVVYLLFFRPKENKSAAADQTTATVGVAKVIRRDMYNEIPIPAEFRPYVQTQLHAIVTGYVSKMLVDFGDRVKKDQVLATINVPELPEQVNNAKANQQQAEAEYDNEHLLYTRLQQVDKEHPNLVAKQDLDTARSKDQNAAAAVNAAKAKVAELETSVTYTNITAPFDGVITQRTVDPGALVQAGTSSDRSREMLQISDNYHLRLDFPVSVDYVQDVKVGVPVRVRVDSLHGKVFTGKITRFQSEVNEQTRTMNTEIEVENPDLEIVPGMYAVVLFQFDHRPNALSVPTEAISNPKSPDVFLVNSEHKIEDRPVKLGVEMPDRFEVTDGLQEGDLVMIGSRAQVHPGQTVDVKVVGQPKLNLPVSPEGETSAGRLPQATPVPLDPHADTSTPPSAVPAQP